MFRRSARAVRRKNAANSDNWNADDGVKFVAALRRDGAPNRASETGQLRDGNVPYADGFMEWAKLSGSRLYADYEFLYGRHPQYFQSPEEVRAAVELVLSMPERVQDLANNMSFVGKDQETGKIYRIEINPQLKRKANHIRSVFEITPEQYEKIKLEKSPVLQPSPTEDINHAAARTISSFLRDNITDSDEKSNKNIKFSVRQKEPPKKIGIGYKVFVVKNGKLYPPMVNPTGVETPIGIWLDAEEGIRAENSKTGRPQVKSGGPGTQGGSGKLAYRPGWHLGEYPLATQFNRADKNGDKTLFPADFVWAEVEYANDIDYQKEAEAEGVTAAGKYQHSLAGLKRIPVDGAYRYRTNPNPKTVPWIITGAMKVRRILSDSEVESLLAKRGIAAPKRQNADNSVIQVKPQTETLQFKRWFGDSKVVDTDGKPLVVYHGSTADFNVFSMKFANRTGQSDGNGFYFTDDKYLALGYQNKEGKLFEVYLQLLKPLTPNTLTLTKSDVRKIIDTIDGDGDYIANYASDSTGYPGPAWRAKALRETVDAIYDSSENNADIIGELYHSFGGGNVLAAIRQKTGYDGFIQKHDGKNVYVVFDPTQIKSATDNIGTFDGNNPDIRFSLAAYSEAEQRDIVAILRPFDRGINRFYRAKRRGVLFYDMSYNLTYMISVCFYNLAVTMRLIKNKNGGG